MTPQHRFTLFDLDRVEVNNANCIIEEPAEPVYLCLRLIGYTVVNPSFHPASRCRRP